MRATWTARKPFVPALRRSPSSAATAPPESRCRRSCAKASSVTVTRARKGAANEWRAPIGDSSNTVTMKWSLAALAFGNFVIGTGTLIVPGLLPYLAESLGVSLPVAGHLITAFAVTICVAAPLLSGATSRYDPRALLVAMQLIILFWHLPAALVFSLTAMLRAP